MKVNKIFIATSLILLAGITSCSDNQKPQSNLENPTSKGNNSEIQPKTSDAASIPKFCNPINTIADKDFQSRGNEHVVTDYQINAIQCMYTNNNDAYKVFIYEKHPIGNVRYLVLHDSEDAAFDSGLKSIQHGGLMVALENQEKRHLFNHANQQMTEIDPNRIFKPTDSHFEFGKFILSSLKLESTTHLIALHNNMADSAFGMTNIKNYGATDIACDTKENNKNLFWLASTAETSYASALAEKLCQDKNYNVVLETVPLIEDGDGSLSIYAANQGINYVNIEIKAAERNNESSEQLAKNQQIQHIQTFLQLIKH